MKAIIAFAALAIIGTSPCGGSELSQTPKAPLIATSCAAPGFTEAFLKYKSEMREHFYRNLNKTVAIPKDVVVRFFLCSDGYIRDAHVQESSGDSCADLTCLDAINCASPLSPPPHIVHTLPPPPLGGMLPPYFLGSNVYDFRFEKNELPQRSREFEYAIIPKEVIYRYPARFAMNELELSSNFTTIESITPELLESMRFQWAGFYTYYPRASRAAILKAATLVGRYTKNGVSYDFEPVIPKGWRNQ